MTKIKTDIDTLYKQGLAKGTVPVTDKSMSAFKKALARKSFFSFSFNNFNIYYTLAGVAFVGLGGLMYSLNSNNEQPIKPLTPSVKEIKVTAPEAQTQVEVVETESSNAPCASAKKQIEQVVSCSKHEEVKTASVSKTEPMKKDLPVSEIKTQTVVEKVVPVTALKPQPALDRIEVKATSSQKQLVQKIDTLYANDTIKTVKRKVRVKWSK